MDPEASLTLRAWPATGRGPVLLTGGEHWTLATQVPPFGRSFEQTLLRDGPASPAARALTLNYDELFRLDLAKLPADVDAVLVRRAPQTDWHPWLILRNGGRHGVREDDRTFGLSSSWR